MTQTLESLFESPNPKVIAEGFTFAEGPIWHQSGSLFFSDIRESKRYRYDTSTGATKLIAENTSGANGMTLDRSGRLVVCQMGLRRVISVDRDDQSDELVVADSYNGKRLNAPNDVVMRSNGDVYFTNPAGRISGPDADIGYSGVYRVTPQGEIHEVCAGMNLPNGLAFSPDESKLYVSNTRPDPKLLVFEMQSDGTATNQQLIDDMPLVGGSEKNGVPDGLKIDAEGRVFCTGPGGIWVWTAEGMHLGVLEFPEVTTNIAWGDDDLRTMYITGHSAVYTMRTLTPGTRPRFV